MEEDGELGVFEEGGELGVFEEGGELGVRGVYILEEGGELRVLELRGVASHPCCTPWFQTRDCPRAPSSGTRPSGSNARPRSRSKTWRIIHELARRELWTIQNSLASGPTAANGGALIR